MPYYQIWENLIRQWSASGRLGAWTDPDNVPLYNDDNGGALSSSYLPEPWWGNDGTKELHCVVVNYNPGQADAMQKRGWLAITRIMHLI